MADDASNGQGRRAETARVLGVDPDLLDYIDDESVNQTRDQAGGEAPEGSDESVSETEIAAAESRSLIVPNRISYGVYLQQGGFGPGGTLWTWVSLRDVCTRGLWTVPIYIAWYERAGWCRRPQTDSYDIRWKIYWRA
jgi:hypothetical protein